jgi:uncharacterized protein (DUF2249 family)
MPGSFFKMEIKMTQPQSLDVRLVPTPQKHHLIFKTFDALGIGEAFQLMNDHEPRPLFYTFQIERKDQFRWEYVEQGPEVWRVNITRIG